MLLRLLLLRFCPVVLLRFCKKRRQVKKGMILLLLCYGALFLLAVWKIIVEKKLWSLLFIPLSMFPHYFLYIFSVWILLRCIWCAWSERVWNRIHTLSLIGLFTGILLETYWNPKILNILLIFLK